MTDETTAEQLAEIEGQGESTPVTEYTPPEGWRVVRFGEQLQPGDVWVSHDGTEQRSNILQWDASAVSGGRCIRRIEPQPGLQPEPRPAEYTPPDGWRVLAVGEVLQAGDVWVNHEGESRPTKRVGERVNDERYIRPIEPQPEPVQVREGRWRTRNGLVWDVTAMPTNHEDYAAAYPWWDGVDTWRNDGRWLAGGSTMDLVEYLGPIEQQPEPQAATIEELRSEVSYVYRVLSASRERVTHLEELVASLRTINEGQEKAFNAANKANDDLQHRLDVVSKEWADQAATSNGLRAQLDKRDAQIRDLKIELDSLQQVPADSPELRQLRADLAEVTRERDQYLDSYQRIFGDLETIRETAKIEAVEAIAEWLEPIRAVDNPNLANETLQHLPQIMRHLTGLDSHAID